MGYNKKHYFELWYNVGIYLADRQKSRHGPVPGRGPVVEKHWPRASHCLNPALHAGVKSTNFMMKQKFLWPNMNKDIQIWVQQCKQCQSVKTKQHTQTAVKRYPPPTQAFEELNLDLIGPLPPSRGYRHILTITDRFTKGCFANSFT